MFIFSPVAYGYPKVLLDGKKLDFDVQPVIEEGCALVPMRGIATALGIEVNWDDKSQTISAKKDDTEIKIVIDGDAFKNGEKVNLEVPAKIINGTTMVPLRFITESFDVEVAWNKDSQTIDIFDKLRKLDTEDFTVYYPEDCEIDKELVNDNHICISDKYSFYSYNPEALIESIYSNPTSVDTTKAFNAMLFIDVIYSGR